MADEEARVVVRGPPRWLAPIDPSKIRREAAPPNMFELLENITTTLPSNIPGVRLGLGDETEREPGAPRVPKTAVKKPAVPGEKKEGEEVDLTAPKAPKAKAEPVTVVLPEGTVGLPASLAELEQRLLAIDSRKKVEVTPQVFVPSNRRAFKQFVIQAYRQYMLPKPSAIPDPDACAKAAAASKSEVKTFAYQSFVRDYIQRASPYRGVLVYHGLGSGKTCTSIASMEALYQADKSKPVYVMTPASLSPNYRGEISKCGPFIFRTDNNWSWVPIPSLKPVTPALDMLVNKIGIPIPSIKKRKGAWLPDPAKSPNFDTLTAEQQKQIKEQINEHMDHRINFVHYNGVTTETVTDWACNNPHMFDGATIIIDEVHNLVRTINNADLETIYKEEPRDLAEYMPRFCQVGKKYRRSYLLYRMLCSAVGCKIVALSATPIINFPQEIAILANMLTGDTRMVEVSSPGLDKKAAILGALSRHPEVDFAEVVPRADSNTTLIRFTPVPSGCRKVIDPSTGAFRGFVRDQRLAANGVDIDRERNHEAWYGRVAAVLKAASITLAEPKFSTVTRLPDIEKPFVDMFIDIENLVVKTNLRLALMARLQGLISFYKGGKADLMAQVTKDEDVFVDMSDLQLKKYTEQRKAEIDKEQQKKKQKPKAKGVPGVTYGEATQSINSTFKIFSRAACNFVFPADMERPIPSDFRDVMRMVGRPGQTEDLHEEAPIGDDLVDGAEEEEAAREATEAANAVEGLAAVGSYEAALVAAVRELRERAGEYFVKGALAQHSPKFQAVIDRLLESRGPALVYSNFKTLEGVGLFGLALETQLGFKKLDIVQDGGRWALSPETATGGPGTPRYITYTGDEDREKRNILLAIFNNKWKNVPAELAAEMKALAGVDNNQTGEIAKVFMITQSGAEGISLANVRQVHIMEPYWNYVRLDQVKGRAIRICSHMDLKPEERTVDVFTYISKFSDKQIKDRSVDETLINMDAGETTDQNVYRILKAKKKLADSILDVMKTSAVDCELNATENGTLACYRLSGVPSMEPLFHPITEIHVAEAEAAIRAAL